MCVTGPARQRQSREPRSWSQRSRALPDRETAHPRRSTETATCTLIQAARAAGARAVLMSVARRPHPTARSSCYRMKHAAETYLAASGVPATIVRATAFLELLDRPAHQHRWTIQPTAGLRSRTKPHQLRLGARCRRTRRTRRHRFRIARPPAGDRRTGHPYIDRPGPNGRPRATADRGNPACGRGQRCTLWPPPSGGCDPTWADRPEPHSRWTATT